MKGRTIHIAGAIGRMGTTTLSIQLVRFIQDNGYTVCYVDLSRQDYIWGVENVYTDVRKDRTTGKVTYAGIELYGNDRYQALAEGKLGDYDFIVCDFGSVREKTFDWSVFAGGDCGILLCGSKPNEIFQTEDALRDQMSEDVITVFNFTDPADHAAIRDMMGQRAVLTTFMPFIPDPFHAGQEYAKTEFLQELMNMVISVMERDGR